MCTKGKESISRLAILCLSSFNDTLGSMKKLAILSLILLSACSHHPAKHRTEYQVGALVWQQSAEVTALQIQAYQLARFKIDEDFKKHGSKKSAIIVDLDETILSNTAYQNKLAKLGESHSAESWTQWVHSRKSTAIAGAVEFLNYVSKKGYEIVYLSNRKTAEFTDSEINLKALGLPVKKDFLLLKEGADRAKAFHRNEIAKTHRIAMQIGDNLIDFSDIYERKSSSERKKLVLLEKNKFGTEYIIIPNPMYGDWESSVYDFNFSLNEKEKAQKRLENLPVD